MRIKSAEFVTSNTDYRKCPSDNLPEYAFVGRSNVGKSSLINMLAQHSSLAKTSSKPGKTQLINHFLINCETPWFLVDLPGYGFAVTSKENRGKWEKMVLEYLLHRENLRCVFVLVDTRIPPQKIDLEFMYWLGVNRIPFIIIGTKTDKISSPKVTANMDALKKALKKEWSELPEILLSSATTAAGREEILQTIENINRN